MILTHGPTLEKAQHGHGSTSTPRSVGTAGPDPRRPPAPCPLHESFPRARGEPRGRIFSLGCRSERPALPRGQVDLISRQPFPWEPATTIHRLGRERGQGARAAGTQGCRGPRSKHKPQRPPPMARAPRGSASARRLPPRTGSGGLQRAPQGWQQGDGPPSHPSGQRPSPRWGQLGGGGRKAFLPLPRCCLAQTHPPPDPPPGAAAGSGHREHPGSPKHPPRCSARSPGHLLLPEHPSRPRGCPMAPPRPPHSAADADPAPVQPPPSEKSQAAPYLLSSSPAMAWLGPTGGVWGGLPSHRQCHPKTKPLLGSPPPPGAHRAVGWSLLPSPPWTSLAALLHPPPGLNNPPICLGGLLCTPKPSPGCGEGGPLVESLTPRSR